MSEPAAPHPYRDPAEVIDAINKASQRVRLWDLSSLRSLMVFLKHAIDHGAYAAMFASTEREWLADRLRDLESNARTIREVVEPNARALRWSSLSILSFAALGSAYRLAHGAWLVAALILLGVAISVVAESMRRWTKVADEIDGVVKDLRDICRAKPSEAPAVVRELLDRQVKRSFEGAMSDAVDVAMKKKQGSQRTGVRVDPVVTQAETGTPEPMKPAARSSRKERRKR